MQGTLYKNDARARQVTRVAQQALDSPSRSAVHYTRRHLSIAPETIAGTLSLWTTYALYNKMLHQRAVALVEAPCREHGIAIQTLGEYPLFSGLKLVHAPTSDVVIVPADEDPLIVTGKFPLPDAVKQRLQAMRAAGVPFDMLYTYIAHEVPPYSVSEEGPLPLEVIKPPAPAQTVRAAERLGWLAHAATTTLIGSTGRLFSESLRASTRAGLVVGTAAALLLDPLIFGAIADERGMATWFVLAQWAW
ncbi:hypothetical protein EPA93_25860 [Ktedonosporobacter rubrisoli]|uniref:Uncharacterized protein n=1 Tax=Ktedonosporobacter rubrisoli TaxID=2509675 RepID=A0A4V0YZC3_KTERU|nr:hypothetical protein [Ktedonosporobacter rubrisoli]QBD79221.1 hypothetical protein EPA93_25860 [Ktedonosporobacter rubrisoli]